LGSEINIIITDDHPAIREGLLLLMEGRPNIKVAALACNGEEAVEQVRRHKPNLVVMDLNMPVMDGLEATQIINSEFPQTKVLIISVNFSPEHLDRAIKAGASGYLLKEMLGEEIMGAIDSVIAGGKFFSRNIDSQLLPDMP
jgi:two-component system, NarL family, nitrate/nitrite response regulator NarL